MAVPQPGIAARSGSAGGTGFPDRFCSAAKCRLSVPPPHIGSRNADSLSPSGRPTAAHGPALPHHRGMPLSGKLVSRSRGFPPAAEFRRSIRDLLYLRRLLSHLQRPGAGSPRIPPPNLYAAGNPSPDRTIRPSAGNLAAGAAFFRSARLCGSPALVGRSPAPPSRTQKARAAKLHGLSVSGFFTPCAPLRPGAYPPECIPWR